MAVYSMTGYASGQRAAPQAEGENSPYKSAQQTGLTLELRSVNGRFLDLTLRLPDELR